MEEDMTRGKSDHTTETSHQLLVLHLLRVFKVLDHSWNSGVDDDISAHRPDVWVRDHVLLSLHQTDVSQSDHPDSICDPLTANVMRLMRTTFDFVSVRHRVDSASIAPELSTFLRHEGLNDKTQKQNPT